MKQMNIWKKWPVLACLVGMCCLYPACSDVEPDAGILPPELSASGALDITRTSVKLEGKITGNMNSVKECGVKYSTSREFPADKTVERLFEELPSVGMLEMEVDGLTPNEQYYYCWFARTGVTEVRSSTGEFTTSATSKPLFGELVVDSIGENYARFSCSITEIGDNALIEYGVSYKQTSEKSYIPVTSENLDRVSMKYSVEVRGLKAQTEYMVRAYAKNSSDETGDSGTMEGYSEVVTVKTMDQLSPQVSTYDVTSAGITSFTVTGVVSEALGSNGVLNECGFCWSENDNPSIADNVKVVDNKELRKDFSYTVTDLLPSTTYYVCAYAKNTVDGSERIGYGEVRMVVTEQLFTPQVSVSSLEPGICSMVATATIENYDEKALVEKGFIWDERDSNLSYEDAVKNGTILKVEDGAKLFKATIKGLKMNTYYHLRAYAIYEGSGVREIGYSGTWGTVPHSFEFYDNIVSTSVGVAYVTSGLKGAEELVGIEVTEKGFCWIKPEHSVVPSLHGEHEGYISVTDGTLDKFSAQLTALDLGFRYWMVPYVKILQEGETEVLYGGMFELDTQQPFFHGCNVTISLGSAVVSSGISNLDGKSVLEVIEKGFCWIEAEKNIDPTLNEGEYDNYVAVTDGTLFSFSGTMEGLDLAVEYRVRPYVKVKLGDRIVNYYGDTTGFTSQGVFFKNIIVNSTMAASTFTSGINMDLLDGYELLEKGFCWRDSGMGWPSLNEGEHDGFVSVSDGSVDSFTATVQGLIIMTWYYVRPYIKVMKDGKTTIMYGNLTSFCTEGLGMYFEHNATANSLELTGIIDNLSEIPSTVQIEEVGFYWEEWKADAESPWYELLPAEKKVSAPLEGNRFTTTLTNLKEGAKYWVGIYMKYNGKMSTWGCWEISTLTAPNPNDNVSPDLK